MSDLVVSTQVVADAPAKKPRKPRRKAKMTAPEDSTAQQNDIKSPQVLHGTTNVNPNTSASKKPESKPSKRHGPSKTAWLLKNTGKTLSTISCSSLLPSTVPVTFSTPATLLCSYNWLLSGHAIHVPGRPPKYTPPPLPHTLRPDSGLQYTDQNAARVPKYPFEPAFRAMAVMNPTLNLSDADIVLNRNSLRKLLDFAGGKRQDPFRMRLSMLGRTLFIERNERSAKMMIHGKSGPGYGHSFERMFTTPGEGLEDSSSHHRVLRYQLGSLDCVVRFEVDAHLEDEDGLDESETAKEGNELIEGIAQAMEKIAVNPATTFNAKGKAKATPNTKPSRATQVLHTGSHIPPWTLLELKTQSLLKNSSISHATPQLYFGRTPNLLVGVHSAGTIISTRLVNTGMTFATWEDTNQTRLRKMVGLLEKLRGMMKQMQGEREAVLVCETKGGDVRVLERRGGGGGVLPEELVQMFWGRECGDDVG